MSTHVPVFEKDETASIDVVDPTVMAVGSELGEYKHASLPSLPAATATGTPAATAAAMARLSAADLPPPSDMDKTARSPRAWASCTDHSSPERTPLVLPVP